MRFGLNHLELEFTCPQNGTAVRAKSLGIRVNLSPKRECGSERLKLRAAFFLIKTSFWVVAHVELAPQVSYTIKIAGAPLRLPYHASDDEICVKNRKYHTNLIQQTCA